jgi:hypothetical protein|tara:strand:- start:129 stop:1064 length:936 start_codon:yes stop_codon:yes gene_type:complete
MQIYQPVRIGKKLVARHVDTKAIAAKSLIRAVQIRNAEANNELLMVSASGRVTRIENTNPKTQPAAPKMSFMSVIEKRDPKQMFANLERLTKMVGKGIQPSLVITGSAGTGKTFLVKDTLTKMGLKESNEFVHFKGRATAAGLFVTLYDNCDKIIVLDDCDSVFKDPDAVNMLKAALDSYDTRNISYITSKPLKDQFGTHLPRSFEFTGKIIFISNLDQSTLDEAIRSRSFVSDISMTTEQMFMRIEGLMEKMENKIPTKAKQQAMTIMKELNEKYDGISVNLRSFIKAARICAMGFENARDMVAEQIIEV